MDRFEDKESSYTPDWVPEEAGDAFAVRVKRGIDSSSSGPVQSSVRRTRLTEDDYVDGVLAGDKTILARTITLIESNSPAHYDLARGVLKRLQNRGSASLRIGITGVPGAGKSTLIEALGMHLTGMGLKVAVLAVDPSSSVTGGSILGDKTRMENLSRSEDCFIRPSPSGGTLGGVTRKSRETVLVCEAAGYDVILIETVGVGQSEITVRSMVDFFLLVLIAGAGDELQGIKKGVIEIADAILINKADGNNLIPAQQAQNEYSLALKYLAPATKGWQTQAVTASAATGKGVPELWDLIKSFECHVKKEGFFESRRKDQDFMWVKSLITNFLTDNFYNNPEVKKNLEETKKNIYGSTVLPTEAAENLLRIYFRDALSD